MLFLYSSGLQVEMVLHPPNHGGAAGFCGWKRVPLLSRRAGALAAGRRARQTWTTCLPYKKQSGWGQLAVAHSRWFSCVA